MGATNLSSPPVRGGGGGRGSARLISHKASPSRADERELRTLRFVTSVIVHYGQPHDWPPAAADKVLDLVAISVDKKRSFLGELAPAMVHGAAIVRPMTDTPSWRHDTTTATGEDRREASSQCQPAPRAGRRRRHVVKFAKSLTGRGAFDKVVGHDLEIVPMADPAGVNPGGELRVCFLFHGAPLAADARSSAPVGTTPVAEKDIPRFRTDAPGVATIPIVTAGPTLLVIDHRMALSATPELESRCRGVSGRSRLAFSFCSATRPSSFLQHSRLRQSLSRRRASSTDSRGRRLRRDVCVRAVPTRHRDHQSCYPGGVWPSFQHVRRGGQLHAEHSDVLFAVPGFFVRLFRGLFGGIAKSWHMYPLGFLFGLGFDAAPEIGLLGISATQVAQGVSP
jgi:nickel transport protein